MGREAAKKVIVDSARGWPAQHYSLFTYYSRLIAKVIPVRLCDPWGMGEQPKGERSLGVPTLLGGDMALAWHAPGGPPRPPYHWRRLLLRGRAPEQSSGTPSSGTPDLSRRGGVREQPMGERSLRVPTLLGGDVALACHAPGGPPRPAYQWYRLLLRDRAPEQSSGTPSRGISGGTFTRGVHVAWWRCGFRMARSWGSPTPSVPVVPPFAS